LGTSLNRLQALSFWTGPAVLEGKMRQPLDRVAHVVMRPAGNPGEPGRIRDGGL